MADEADCRVKALEVEIILQAHRQAVQGAQCFTRTCQILISGFGRLQSPIEASLGKTVGLYTRVSDLLIVSWMQTVIQVHERRMRVCKKPWSHPRS